jgi:hypothetical protein
MNRKILETKIIVSETADQIEVEDAKSVFFRDVSLLTKLHDYLIAKIDELSVVGEIAKFGDDIEPCVLTEIEDRRNDRLRKINNRKRSMERSIGRSEEAKKKATAQRILDKFAKTREFA